ncbi:hypothetical protein [Clostridium sp. BJN0001]|uniref:hypothetical protein n=1 Tax=Clostridium sp. BJN0001 TaxID=2930219 RepID=UPI001FD3B20C|nr:hypothetical protein [Clostridium sp. BJN0001]
MTILTIMSGQYAHNEKIMNSINIIRDNYVGRVNDNYELTLDSNNELCVKIPSLKKRDEFEFHDIKEYEYPLIMCMRISSDKDNKALIYMQKKFMDTYRDKLDLFFKDVYTTEILYKKISSTKANIQSGTYASIAAVIAGSVGVCVLDTVATSVRYLIVLAVVAFFILAMILQLTKESMIKKVIDAYLSIIKTDWYRKELAKQYAFLVNYV